MQMFINLVWRCLRCGYIVSAAEPPDRCPDCGGPREEFEHVEED